MVMTPSGPKQQGHAGDEVVELRNLRQNIVGGDQVGVAVLGDDLSRGFGVEECGPRRDAPGASRLGHVGGGLDTEHPLTELDEMLQQVAVVAAELDDEAVRPKIEPRLHRLAVALGVRHPARRVGGEIGIFGEDVGGAHELGQLHEPTGIANPDVERVIGLRLAELFCGEKALTQRRHAEIDEGVLEPLAAMAAADRLLG